MIISFSLENWMSFRDKVTFSMIAGRERQHGDRVPRSRKYRMGILPIAAIYGGNASGKTNFFKALNFVKKLVVGGTRPDSLIPVEPFRLDAKGVEQPSRFSFELLIDKRVYEFSFAVTRKEVREEKLVDITSTSERVLYHRQDGEPNFDDSLAKSQPLLFAFKGTRDNQLFLTNSISQKINNFQPVYNWFKNTLRLVAPDSRFGSFEQFFDEKQPFYSAMNEMLRQFDTGIVRLDGEEIPFENITLPGPIKTLLQEDVREGVTVNFFNSTNERFLMTREGEELIVKKLVTYHKNLDGKEVKFDIKQESDGSQRLMNILPAFFDLSNHIEKVYVIDELDRNLHTLLTRRLLEAYLANCSTKTRTQLLLTTHDVLLMDQKLLRRDEMWVAERDATGASNLLSFSDYKDVRYDKDIRKSYLQGRLGGIPRILLGDALTNLCLTEESRGDD